MVWFGVEGAGWIILVAFLMGIVVNRVPYLGSKALSLIVGFVVGVYELFILSDIHMPHLPKAFLLFVAAYVIGTIVHSLLLCAPQPLKQVGIIVGGPA